MLPHNWHKKVVDMNCLPLEEAEITLPLFLADLENNSARKVYRTSDYADSFPPVPLPPITP